MSTQSATGFEWSVKIIGTSPLFFSIGIASKLERGSGLGIDEEAILFTFNDYASVHIRRGSTKIHSGLENPKTGDVVSFKFQPYAKKFTVYWVRNIESSSTNL